MAYQYCGAHQEQHRAITPAEKQEILNAYTEGTAQIVTTEGVKHRCILDIIGRSYERNERTRSHGFEPISLGV